MSDDRWAFVAPYLTLITEDAPQRVYDLREVYIGLRYIARSGYRRSNLATDLLAVPLGEQVLAPCWSCGSVAPISLKEANSTACWPPVRATQTQCSCALELRPGRIAVSTGSKQ